MMTAALDLATRLADEIEQFPLGRCGPSDDPDMQYAYVAPFRDLVVRFVAAIKRVGDTDLASLVAEIDTDLDGIVFAHELRAKVIAVIDALREAAEDPEYGSTVAANASFLSLEALGKLRQIQGAKFDTRKLVRMCEELNEAYARGNYISAALLLRAVLNHVPPVFGTATFAQVVANSGRSVKAILGRLEDTARPIADLHAHQQIRSTESLPSKNQLEPYKAGFEVLIHEVVGRLGGNEL